MSSLDRFTSAQLLYKKKKNVLVTVIRSRDSAERHDAQTKDLCHFKTDEQRKENRDWTKVPDAHLRLAKNDYHSKTVPGVILLSISSQQDQCLVQQIQDRHSWFTRFGVRTILSSRPSATLEAITRSDSADFESAGRYMMRLVTSCITGRRPHTPAGATCREP